MLNFLSVGFKFCLSNGLLNLSLRKISQLRAGDDNPLRVAHSIQPSKTTSDLYRSEEIVAEILADDKIPDDFKKPFREVRETLLFDNSEARQQKRLIKSLEEKAKYPVYSKIKGKLPYILLTPFTFTELNRLAAYRLSGLVSAPLTLPAIIGFSLPCAVTFSMLEMYAPNKFKFPCKCAKWAGGFVFYGVSSAVDYATAGYEKKFFGSELPIDAPQLMGTLPTTYDLDKLKDSIIQKSLLGED